MSSENDENKLKEYLNEIIPIIESTIINLSSYSNEINAFDEKKQIMENLTILINSKLKEMLDCVSSMYREYFLYLFTDYKYDYSKGKFNETIKGYILDQLLNDLCGIRDSFDAFQSAFTGTFSYVKNFLEKYPKYKDKSGIWGTTLLYSSSRNNHIHIVKYLCQPGKCNVNVQNENHSVNKFDLSPTSGSTPLHAACYYGHLNIVKYLIDNGGDYFIKNDAQETAISNGLLRDNIREFFDDILIYSYNDLINIPPQSTILNDNKQVNDSVWEYKSINSDQWIQFDQKQSNQLQKFLIFQKNKNYNQNLPMNLNNQIYSISLIQFSCLDYLNKDPLWMRCRASSITNFNCYSKWQILFEKCSSIKSNKSVSLQVFQIDQNENIQLKVKLNHWYYFNDQLNEQIDNAMNYRRKYLHMNLHFINEELFLFNFKTFSFTNNDNSIKGCIRWIPIYQIENTQTICNNFQSLTNLNLIPLLRNNSVQIDNENNHNQDSAASNGDNEDVSMTVRFGDLIEDTSDVIVVCWSSRYLLETIYDCGGLSIRTAVNNQLDKRLKNSLTSVQSDGDIKSKRIYFLHWQIESQIDLVKKSLENLISLAMQKAHNDNYRSIAFPAIGCGDYQYPIQLVAQTMVNKAHQEQILHKLSVSFVIQPTKKDLFQHFDKQINLLNQSTTTDFVSTTIQNSLIQIEKGDITKQKVDVIVVSSSSDYLRQIVIIEGGEQVYEAYEKENNSNPNSLLISTLPGNLSCKRIFFIKWKPDENENMLRQSIIDFIWNVIQNCLSHQFESIAFPSIGSSHPNISQDIIVHTLIDQLIYQIKNRNLSLTIKFIILPDEHQIYQQFCQQLLTSEQDIESTIDDKVPSTWELSAGNKYRFILSQKSNEYQTIAGEFHRAMKGKMKKILSIERIQNERWYFQYLAHKKDFFKRLNKDTEKRLYHGCPENAVNSIVDDCFNRSFAGVNGTSFGVGVYFSLDATYSNQFSKANSNGDKFMFISRVLIGNTTLGNPSMKTRPPGFDTTTDGNHIYVTYHDAQAYAEYLITYK